MYWKDRFNGFDLHEQALIDEQIESEQFFSLELFVPNHYPILALDRMPSQFKLHRQAPFVNRFEQSRTFILMDFNRSANRVVSYCGGLRK